MARSAAPLSSSAHHPISCPEEVLFVELMRTADLLARAPARLLKDYDLSPNQYNVLRILRGSPEGLLCGEISARMITRDPDITRLLDRLEKCDLIGRCREDPDRRRVHVRITPTGLALLGRLDHPLCDLHRHQLGHLGPARVRELTAMLAAGRKQPG